MRVGLGLGARVAARVGVSVKSFRVGARVGARVGVERVRVRVGGIGSGQGACCSVSPTG